MVLEFPHGAETPFDKPIPRRIDADFRLSGHHVQTRLNRIRTAEETHQIEPKIMQVLVCLAENAGEVVGREALIDRVWEGAFVSDDVLTRCIGELRKVFDDDPVDPRVVETMRKRGYRLIAPIEFRPGRRDRSQLVARRTEHLLRLAALWSLGDLAA